MEDALNVLNKNPGFTRQTKVPGCYYPPTLIQDGLNISEDEPLNSGIFYIVEVNLTEIASMAITARIDKNNTVDKFPNENMQKLVGK